MGDTDLKVLYYATSGDVTGDRKSVVGYSACALVKNVAPVKTSVSTAKSGKLGETYTPGQRKRLLAIVRETVESVVRSARAPQVNETDPAFNEPHAVFVTLRKNGQLRGCIGRLSAEEPLAEAVQRMAIESATKDPRFEPVREGELKDLEYEISVLSPPRRAKDAGEIELGKHGVILRQGHRSGVFLPNVVEETGWSKEEFLSELCSQKAGLATNCWRDPKTELQTFTAEEF